MYRRTQPRASRRVSLLFLFLFFENIAVFAVDCPECKQSYPDFTRLAVHVALQHELWLCPNCQKTFPVGDKKAYRQHRVEKHGETVCFVCNLRVFRDKNEWQQHRKKHKEKVLSLFDNSPCCPQMPSDAGAYWVQKLHTAHRHGSWIDFLFKVRPLHKCCEPFRNAVFETCYFPKVFEACYFPKYSERTFLKSMKDFSKHVCKMHRLCFLCERELGNTDMFKRQAVYTDFFLRPRGNMFSPKMESFSCFCGKSVQRNAESRLFALKIDRLPFGTGLDTVTHPFYCIIDENENEKKDPPERLKAGNAMSPKSGGKSARNHSDKPIKGNSGKPQSPSFSTESVDTTLTSIDDKKLKKLPVFGTNVVPPTDNEINVK